MANLDFLEKSKLVDALLKCDCMRDANSRDQIVNQLPEVANEIARAPSPRDDVLNIVSRCENHDGGIERLLEIVEWRQPSLKVSKPMFRTAFKVLTAMPKKQVDDLVAVGLKRGDISSEDLAKLYREYHPPNDSLDEPMNHPLSAMGALLRLFQLASFQLGFEFAAQMATKVATPKRLALELWLKNAEAALGTQSGIHKLNDAQAFLLIQVKPYDHRNETFILYYWVLKNGRIDDLSSDEPGSAEAKPFNEIVHEVERLAATALGVYSELTVEMIVPRDLFQSDLTEWKLNENESFLRQLKTVFRCHDRFDARQKELAAEKRGQSLLQTLKGTKVRLRSWQNKCTELRELGRESVEEHFFGILGPDQYQADELNEKFKNRGDGLLISLGFALHADCGTGWWKALDYGAPLAVWLRETPDGLRLDEQRLKALLRAHNQPAVTLDELPDHIWRMQKSALQSRNKSDLKYHLALLYDDYERVPQPP